MQEPPKENETAKSQNDKLIPVNSWGEGTEIDYSKVQANLQTIQNDIAHCNIKIVAVTKYFGLNAIIAGYKAGIRNFGESRAVDAIAKLEQLPKEIKQNSVFHFIGHLQTNKAEKVVKYFDVIETVDSLKLAKIISKSACYLNKREKVLLQVNNAGEIQKSGKNSRKR